MFSIEMLRTLRSTLLTLISTGFAGRLGEHQVELQVGPGELGHVVPGGLHAVVDGLQVGQVLPGRALGREGGRAALDDAPVLENVEDVGGVEGQQRDEGVEVDVARELADEGPLAVAGFEDADGSQALDPLAQRDAADPHAAGELVFGGDLAAGRPRAAQHLVAQLAEHLGADAFLFNGLQLRGQPNSLPSSMGLSDILHPTSLSRGRPESIRRIRLICRIGPI